MASSKKWQVLILDLKASRKIPPSGRRAVDKALIKAAEIAAKRYQKDFRLAPRLLKGDELEAVLRSDAPSLLILTFIRAQFAMAIGRTPALRAGIGWGRIDHMDSENPFESDGPAFHAARAALDAVKGPRSGRLTGWVTGTSFDAEADAVLPVLDVFFRRWSRPQWEAVAKRIEERNLREIGAQLGVRLQAIHKRLSTASWDETLQVMHYLQGRFAEESSSPPETAVVNTPLPGRKRSTRKG
jgi:SatD family (SatD)